MLKEESTIGKIVRIIPEVKKGFTISVLVGIFYEIVKFIPVILIKYLIDFFVEGQTLLTTVVYIIGGILIAHSILMIIDNIIKKRQFYWLISYEAIILKKAKKKLLEMHLAFHESYNTGMQVSKITKGSHKLAELLWFTFNEFIPTIIQMVLTVALLLYEQWILAAIFGLFLPAIVAIVLHAGRRVQGYRKHYHRVYDDAVGELGESLINISTVKDYVQEKSQIRKFNNMMDEFTHYANKRADVSFGILIWRDVLITLGRAATVGVAAYMVLQGMLTAGSLVLVYSLTERAFLSTFRIGRLYNYLEDAMESINRLGQLFKRKSEITDIKKAESVKKLFGEIEFSDVTFSYSRGKPVLRNINLRIEPKQVVAFVGKSGSGKTTLVKLLLRNYDIINGKLSVDGRDIKNYKISDYKKRIAVVSQSVEVFNRSVMQNLLFANPGATRERAIKAAKKAHAHKFIMEFHKGYDTIVGEKGVRLSGGQKQRLSIARALLRNPDIYIFDEATSSLDSESEGFIQKSIFSIAGKKTTIIIAHRLSTIRHADKIIVVDNGKIVEEGTYKELLRLDGHFTKMVKLQKVGELRE